MIARISNPGSFLSGAVKYNTDKVELGGGELIACRNFNVKPGTVLDAATAELFLTQQLNLNTRVEKGVFACSLNPNLEDLTSLKALCEANNCATKDELYTKMASLYMQGMGYGEQPFMVFRHNDIDREHIHIVSIRVDGDGNRISNYNEHIRSERVRAQVNEAMGLSTKGEIQGADLSDSQRRELAERRYAFMERTRDRVSGLVELSKNVFTLGDPESLNMLVKQGETKLFHNMSNALKYVSECYLPKDIKEYNRILSQFNIVCKTVDAEDGSGKRFSGCQYAVIDGRGEVCSHLIKGSSFGKEYSMTGLEKRFALANSEESLREHADVSRNYIKSSIDSILRAPVKIDFQFLSEHLKGEGITMNLAKSLDNPDKIQGVNFIDNINGATFNGSNLGKAYSYLSMVKAIESHNSKIEREANRVPAEAFKAAIRVLSSEFAAIRKADFRYESDAIGDLKNRKKPLSELLQDKLMLTERQAESVVDTFCRLKYKSLPEIDYKEKSYAQRCIAEAVLFSSRIGDPQKRRDFFERAGIVPEIVNDALYFRSKDKENISLTFREVCERLDMKEFTGKFVPIGSLVKPFRTEIPECSENLERLNKAERQLVSSIANKDDRKIGGDFTELAKLLDSRTRSELIERINLSKEDRSESFRIQNSCMRSLMRDGSYKYQSDLVKNLDSHRDMFLDAMKAAGMNEMKAQRAFGLFREATAANLPNIVEKEKEAAVNRFVTAAVFAQNIKEPADRNEFLLRMGVSSRIENGVLSFSRTDKPEYKASYYGLVFRDERLSPSTPTFTSSVPAAPSDIVPFTKKERDFVSSYVRGTILADKVNSLHTEPAFYLSRDEQNRITRLGNTSRVNEILSRNPEATIMNTVKALWSRGYVVKPFNDGPNTVFKVGMHFAKDETYVPLPKEIQQRLADTNYLKSYPDMRRLVLDGKWDSPKMQVLKSITRSADYNDPKYLLESIDRVAKTNRVLAKAMTEAMGNAQKPDYDRVMNLVFNYNGEKTIVLPPPSDARNSFIKQAPEKVTSYDMIMDAMCNGSILQAMMDIAEMSKSNSKRI